MEERFILKLKRGASFIFSGRLFPGDEAQSAVLGELQAQIRKYNLDLKNGQQDAGPNDEDCSYQIVEMTISTSAGGRNLRPTLIFFGKAGLATAASRDVEILRGG